MRVLLVNQRKVPHYRVGVYNALAAYLQARGAGLSVVSEGVEGTATEEVQFRHFKVELGLSSLTDLIRRESFDVVILWVDMKNLYLLPLYVVAKFVLHAKTIYWGQGRDLLDRNSAFKNLLYSLEHQMCDAIVLYADHLKKYVSSRHHRKLFVANNTVGNEQGPQLRRPRELVLDEHGIHTSKNIVCIGRMQKRKRVADLLAAVARMRRPDVGLILVGPDSEGILDGIQQENVYCVGPLYGARKYELLQAADVCCQPGAVGLSIVDAFRCGLPFVAADGDESAERMYLKDSLNGFVVPSGDIDALSQRLLLLLDNEELRRRFSAAAMAEIARNGQVAQMCWGFWRAIEYVTGNRRRGPASLSPQL